MGENHVKRSGSYPLQTPDFTPAYVESHDYHSSSEKFQDQPRLPKSIRALKNSHDKKHHPKTVVICLDGTGDQFDDDNSNIVHFVSCLKKHTPEKQVTYYQSGIGTYDKGGLSNGIGAAMDMAVGSGLGIHIKDAYHFLMQNYHDGDKICLLGFSRGAYTVRCLAGMLHKVGLLPASNVSQVNFAYDFYKDDSEQGWDMSAEFKKTFCTNIDVWFLGLFDCVASVGFIPRKLPFSKSPTNSVHYFRHAMALDEHRAKFKVAYWAHTALDRDREQKPQTIIHRPTVDMTPKARIKRSGFLNYFRTKPDPVQTLDANHDLLSKQSNLSNNTLVGGTKNREQKELESRFEAQDENNRKAYKFQPDVREVWFRGSHADVGGGAVSNTSRHMLSRIPLRWMIRQCFECETGILFDSVALAEQGLDVHTLWPKYLPPTRPHTGPPPSLMTKYEQGILQPIRRRSTFLPIGPQDNRIKHAPTEADLRYILPSEATEDYFDAMAKSNDQLVDAKGWWILEFWPVKLRLLCPDGLGWEKKIRLNLGRYRAVRETEPKMHWTVKHMIDEGLYEIKARTTKHAVWEEVV